MADTSVKKIQCLFQQLGNHTFQVPLNFKLQVLIKREPPQQRFPHFLLFVFILGLHEVAYSIGFQGDSVLLTDKIHIVLLAPETL